MQKTTLRHVGQSMAGVVLILLLHIKRYPYM